MPVIPTLMGWGCIPDDHPLMAGMVGLQTSHRYGNATFLKSDFVLGIGNRWANRHTGTIESYTKGRKFVHVDIEPTQIGRVFNPDFGIVSDAKAALELFVAVAKERKAAGKLQDRDAWAHECEHRKLHMLRKTHYDQVPLKPQRVYEEMNEEFGRDTCYVTTIGLSQIAGAQFLHVYKPRNWINCGQAGPLGWTLPAALGVRAADPDREIVALSGDYDFQFMIEELAVGAQHKLPYLHVVVNNSYLGLIRQSQRGFKMDFEVSLAFDNINSDEVEGYGVDHVAVAEGLGCKAVRVKSPNEFKEAFATAEQLMEEHQVPVVLEFILERVTNISMGTDIHNVSEFEEILCLDPSLRDRPGLGLGARGRRGGGGAGPVTLRASVAVERAAGQPLQMVEQTVGAGRGGIGVAVDDRAQRRGVDLRALGERATGLDLRVPEPARLAVDDADGGGEGGIVGGAALRPRGSSA